MVKYLRAVVLAAFLLGVTTLLRSLLTPQLGHGSPFMLFVAAVLVAAMLGGLLPGLLVAGFGGVIGLLAFLSPDDAISFNEVVSLLMFWLVSSVVLMAGCRLRRQAHRAFPFVSWDQTAG